MQRKSATVITAALMSSLEAGLARGEVSATADGGANASDEKATSDLAKTISTRLEQIARNSLLVE